MLTLGKIKRNDLQAVRQFYVERGQVSSDDFRILLRLQDDSDELVAIADREKWKIIPTKF